MDGLPKIIQGGMGIGVSGWRLARAVSSLGQLGVVSGSLLDAVLSRRLQDGDAGGQLRFAFDHFPLRDMAKRVWQKHFVPGGKRADEPYRGIAMHAHQESRETAELCIVANFVEVFLARQGHDRPVGINYLEKIQPPHLPSIFGAMLAGVGYVIMGAGIPTQIPRVLNCFARNEPADYDLQGSGVRLHFDPREFWKGDLQRPQFLPIISSNALAGILVKRSDGRVDGFVVEGPTAGGHNAPPRGPLRLSAEGEPIYGERDVVDWNRLREHGLPFWVAGGCATPEKLRELLQCGAAGIQVGTAFAFCEESGLKGEYKRRLLQMSRERRAEVFTDPTASPTGYPFKVAKLEGSLSEANVYDDRKRVCDLGYLREAYRKPDGTLGYRCPAEPIETFLSKGGRFEETEGRKCLCNGLISTIGHPQIRGGITEPPILTSGDDLKDIARFLPEGRLSYTARDVIERLLCATN